MENFLLKTKGNYPHNSRNNKLRNYLLGGFVFFLLLLFGKDFFGGISSVVTTPLFLVRHYLETSSATVPVFIRSRVELLNEIHGLQQEVSSLQGIEDTVTFM